MVLRPFIGNIADPGGKMQVLEQQNMFIAEVEEERKAQKISKCQLSMRAYNVKSTYYNYLAGKRQMSIRAADKVAKVLGMKVVVCLMEDDS